MKIGLMNNPRSDLAAEIDFIASSGFDFIDITLEYPKTHIDVIDRQGVLTKLSQSGLEVIGHTTYYLPFASPINAIREAAVNDVIRCLGFFKEAGARIVTVHPDPGIGAIETKTTISLNALSFKIISDEAAKHDLTVVVENVPGAFSSVESLNPILKAVPGLRFHLDVGHAFINRNRFKHLLSTFKDKLLHVHVSDNRWRGDDHMPLGAGNINWKDVIAAIKNTGYDSTFTLEVFSDDRRYVLGSRDKLKELWKGQGQTPT
jgi:sugar phosphate isomerase/epimerase